MGLKKVIAGATLCTMVAGAAVYANEKFDLIENTSSKFNETKELIIDYITTDLGEKSVELLMDIQDRPGEVVKYHSEIASAVNSAYQALPAQNRTELVNMITSNLSVEDKNSLMNNVYNVLPAESKNDLIVAGYQDQLPTGDKLILMKQTYDSLPDKQKMFLMKTTFDGLSNESRINAIGYMIGSTETTKDSGNVFLEAGKNYGKKLIDDAKIFWDK